LAADNGSLKGTSHERKREGEVRTDVTKVQFIDLDELKILWRMLQRLQADVTPVGGASNGRTYLWRPGEIDALVTVMDAVKDSR
jgi:hypothetical protein